MPLVCSNNEVTLTAVDRSFGEYCRSLDTRSTASAGILLWKIQHKKTAMEDVNLGGGQGQEEREHNPIQHSYLMPWVSFDLREFKLGIIWIHALNFFTCGCAQNLTENEIKLEEKLRQAGV